MDRKEWLETHLAREVYFASLNAFYFGASEEEIKEISEKAIKKARRALAQAKVEL